MASKLVATQRTLITLPEYIRAVIRAWSEVSDEPCRHEAVAVLWAQYIIETGGKHCYGWNLGNVKHVDGDGFDYHCLKGVWEGLSQAQAARVIASGEAVSDPSADHQKAVGTNRRSVVFNPPHPATRFRCYPDLDTAMRSHLTLLAKKRYAAAWPAVLKGDYRGFAMSLKQRGYFTASAESYAAGMKRPYEEARASGAFAFEMGGNAEPIGAATGGVCAWVRVGDWLVAPDYIAPVGIGEALEIATAQGCELPTPALVDAIWAAADLRVEPHTRNFAAWTMAEMNSDEATADQARRLVEAIGGREYRLLAGSHKDVVMVDGKLGLYGWHRGDGKVIQGLYQGHGPAWKDYSQGLRLVRAAE